MELIVNEVELKKKRREEEKQERLKREGKLVETEENAEEKKEKPVVVCRTATDMQKRKLDKLMSDMSKDAYIPEPRKEWKPREPPEFVRHVMGSSAGAGSGEFHVYRGIRKRENKRQEFLDRKAMKDKLDEEFDDKVQENKRKADEATAKKREKRQRKKKKKMLSKKLKKDVTETKEGKDESSDEDDDDDDGVNEDKEDPHFVIRGE